MRLSVGLFILLLTQPAPGALLDPDSPPNALLDQLAPVLEKQAIDVARNLNAVASKPRSPPRSPRLGLLADIPVGALANSIELLQWETSYREGAIGAIAALPGATEAMAFPERWLEVAPRERILITYATADRPAADILVQELEKLHYDTQLFHPVQAVHRPDSAPPLYATAGHRLVLDSQQARRAGGEALEIKLLGKSLSRRGSSVFPASGRASRYYVAGEPERFRKADLGDEQVAASIPEIIVSGGIALGERASFPAPVRGLEFTTDQRFQLLLESGETLQFAEQDPLLQKACFDFAVRSLNIESDAIVDIDERHRVKLSAAFRNTAIGLELIDIDAQPFHYVNNLSAIKSVIIDTSVAVDAKDSLGTFATTYEIRFINPDRRKLAETRVALVYQYDSATGIASYRNSWGPRAFRVNKVEFAALGEATRKAAVVAGWVALFRAVEDSSIDFSRGRYEFLTVDKVGAVVGPGG